MGKKYILDDKIFKEFTLIDIATVEYGNKFDKNKMSRINPSVNFVSRTATNNGISDFVDNNGTIPYKKGLITLALGGSVGSCFLQEQPFYTGQNVGVIDLGDIDYHAKIYFTEALGYKCKKSFSAFGNEINKHLKTNLSVSLPIEQDGNGNPVIDVEKKHHQKGYIPDWNFMQKYIEELEKERIEELEKYLLATRLNDYQLTDEDIDVLSLSLSGLGLQEERDGEDVLKISEELKSHDVNSENHNKEFREFLTSKLFDIHPTKAYKMSNGELYKTEGDTPVLSNSSANNGIGGYSGLKPTEDGKIITFSDTTTGTDTLFYQQDAFIGYPHVQGMYPYDKEHWNEKQCLYFIGVMKAACGDGWSYSNKFTRTFVSNTTPLLPIQTDEDNNPVIDPERKHHPDGYIPDWDFMEKYIRAIEKVVIADVVKYKDEVIAKTKETVG